MAAAVSGSRKARRRSVCPAGRLAGGCGGPISPGELIVRLAVPGGQVWIHLHCHPAVAGRRRAEDVFLPGDRPAR